jgi:hypothetical protein
MLDARLEEVRARGRDKFRADKQDMEAHLAAGRRGEARKLLARMTERYYGDAELERQVRDLRAKFEG